MATLTRRGLLRASIVAPWAVALAACTGSAGPAQTEPTGVASAPGTQPPPVALAPTPECGDDDDATLPQTEGPFFTPRSPERTSLLQPALAGTKLVLSGLVLTTDCRPVAGALLDFWQCDDAGVYDNVGYRLRGHQFADSLGRYSLETVVPGLYPGRTRHIHVKAQAPNRPVLTSQLYFPGEARNRSDSIFNPELLVTLQDTPDGKLATFNFVLNVV